MNEWTKERHEAAKALYSDEPELHVGAYCEEGDYFPICDRGEEVGRATTKQTAEVFANAASDAVDMLEAIEVLKEQRDAWARYHRATMTEAAAIRRDDKPAREKAHASKVSALGDLLHLGIDPHVNPFGDAR